GAVRQTVGNDVGVRVGGAGLDSDEGPVGGILDYAVGDIVDIAERTDQIDRADRRRTVFKNETGNSSNRIRSLVAIWHGVKITDDPGGRCSIDALERIGISRASESYRSGAQSAVYRVITRAAFDHVEARRPRDGVIAECAKNLKL